MPKKQDKNLGAYVWRGGQRLELSMSPDRVTARVKRGKGAAWKSNNHTSAMRVFPNCAGASASITKG